jgi:ribA/ribD-fused uncharacterized protein
MARVISSFSGKYQARTPGLAKHMGRAVELRPFWNDIRNDVMRSLLRAKFSDPELAEELLDTGDKTLIEGNTWHDTYWGATQVDGKWVGANHLGRLLMLVRKELRDGAEG